MGGARFLLPARIRRWACPWPGRSWSAGRDQTRRGRRACAAAARPGCSPPPKCRRPCRTCALRTATPALWSKRGPVIFKKINLGIHPQRAEFRPHRQWLVGCWKKKNRERISLSERLSSNKFDTIWNTSISELSKSGNTWIKNFFYSETVPRTFWQVLFDQRFLFNERNRVPVPPSDHLVSVDAVGRGERLGQTEIAQF